MSQQEEYNIDENSISDRTGEEDEVEARLRLEAGEAGEEVEYDHDGNENDVGSGNENQNRETTQTEHSRHSSSVYSHVATYVSSSSETNPLHVNKCAPLEEQAEEQQSQPKQQQNFDPHEHTLQHYCHHHQDENSNNKNGIILEDNSTQVHSPFSRNNYFKDLQSNNDGRPPTHTDCIHSPNNKSPTGNAFNNHGISDSPPTGKGAGAASKVNYQQYLQYQQQHQQQKQINHHQRIDSEDLYNTMKNDMHNHFRKSSSLPKFYDSDIDTENESIIFNPALKRGEGGGEGSNNSHHLRIDSMGSAGSYYHHLGTGAGSSNGGQHHFFHTNTYQQHNQQQQQQYSMNNEYGSSSYDHNSNINFSSRRGRDLNIDTGGNNEGVLPYHKRKRLQEKEQDNQNHGSKNNDKRSNYNHNDNKHFNNRNKVKAELSTISTQHHNKPNDSSSPPQYKSYSSKNNNHNNYPSPSNSNNYIHNHNYFHQLPPMHENTHLRKSSSGYQRERTYSDSSNQYSPKSETESPSSPPPPSNNHHNIMFSHHHHHHHPPRGQQHQNRHYNTSNNNNYNQQPPLHPNHPTNPRWNRHEFDNEEITKPKATSVPTLHIRAESTGSISSLGSLTGGASSISRARNNNNNTLLDKRVNDDTGDDDYVHHHHNDNRQSYNHHHNIIEDRRNNQVHHQSIGRQGSGFLSSILGSISITSGDDGEESVNSLESEKAEFHLQNQNFLKRAGRDKAKRMNNMLYNSNAVVDDRKKMLPDMNVALGGGRTTTMRSLSPGARSQRSHRPKLPSIDNDDWGEDNNDRHGKSQRTATFKHNRRYSRNKKQVAVGYGAMNKRGRSQHKKRERKPMKDPHLNTTQKLSNVKKQDNRSIYSDSGSESDDSSCYSSDFTSNQKDDESSVYMENGISSSDNISFEDSQSEEDENERTSLLQPHGISTGELSTPTSPAYRERRYQTSNEPPGEMRYLDNKTRNKRSYKNNGKKNRHPYNRRRSINSRSSGNRYSSHYADGSDNTDSSSGNYEDHKVYLGDIPEREREKLLKQWKMEFFQQQKMLKMQEEEQYCHNRFKRWLSARNADFVNFVSNLPLTIGAIALAIVTLGIVWFKFAEQMLSICYPVHYHSSDCTFSEFPGCMSCDTSAHWYKVALNFHLTCSVIAGVIALLIATKICIAKQLFIDEMNSPTTASPAGLLCMTLVCVFAGKGMIGQYMVTVASTLHFCIAVWFIHMAGAYNILPDPSWYPNTVGIGITASKMWLYHPLLGHLLMATSLSLNALFFPISLVRVSLNKKLSATVTWIQMSAPAAALCSLTIMGQPSFKEEYPDITSFQRMHRILYIPAMHFLFAGAILGVISSVQSLITRWDSFSKKAFSPAHAAFCFPTLAHTNAIQNYRSAILQFSELQSNATFMKVLDVYWIIFLCGGTVVTLIITLKFFYMLPSWTKVDVEDEIEPPAPNETIMSDFILAGQIPRQNFVSPAVLQANEAGALVRIPGRQGERARYARTRRVTALGFEPIMNLIEFNEERDALLDWVAKNPPRQRKRTMSVPGITSNIANFGSNNRGVYNGNMPAIGGAGSQRRRARAQTSDWNYTYGV